MAAMPTSLNTPLVNSTGWDAPLNENFGPLLNSWFYTGAIRNAADFADVQSAINDLPAAGGVVDASSPGVNLALGTIDPGARSVTLLLGPNTYTAVRIQVRSGFRISGSSEQTTIIQADPTTANYLIGTSSALVGASGCVFENFRMYSSTGFDNDPSPTNSLDGFQFNARSASTTGGVLWYAEFRNVEVMGFGGNSWHFLGASAVGELGFHQFVTFLGCTGTAIGGANGAGGNALRMEGAMYQFFFLNCQFDGPTGNASIDTSAGTVPNIFLGGGPGAGVAGYPYIVAFDGCTSQGREVLVQVDGALDVTFRKMHHEQGYGAYRITYGDNGANVPTQGIDIRESSFNGNVGVNAGNGYILKVETANVAGIHITNNLYAGVGAGPDAWLISSAVSNAISANQNHVQGASNQLLGGGPVRSVVAVKDLTAQTAAISATTIYTPVVSGSFRVSAYLKVTTVASTGAGTSTLGAVTITYTDATDSVAQSQIMQMQTEAGAAATTNALNTTAAKLIGSVIINAKAGVAIQYAIAYASNTAAQMAYEAHLEVEARGSL